MMSAYKNKSAMKRFGIHMTLPPSDPMRRAHLLGEAWDAYRWYRSAEERDAALAELQKETAGR